MSVCACCGEGLLVGGQVCSVCTLRVHRSCSVLLSVSQDTRAHVCTKCGEQLLAKRAERGREQPFRTEGQDLPTQGKLTMRGVESFFKYLKLQPESSPEDYRRDREQKVFSFYKKVGGKLDPRIKMLEVAAEQELRQPMTVFVPPVLTLDEDGAATVCLMFHGGAFVMGSHDAPFAVQLLSRVCLSVGAICVSANYRKAPENKFPAWNVDASRALAFCWDELAGMEGIPDVAAIKIVTMGDSAGGNLACAVAHQHRDKVFGALLFYPILDLASFDTDSWMEMGRPEKHLLLTRELALAQTPHLFVDPEHDAKLPMASPLREVDWSNLPRVHMMAAKHDPLCDDSLHYFAKRRAEAGRTDEAVSVSVYSRSAHGFLAMPLNCPDKREAEEEMVAVLKSWALQTDPTRTKRII